MLMHCDWQSAIPQVQSSCHVRAADEVCYTALDHAAWWPTMAFAGQAAVDVLRSDLSMQPDPQANHISLVLYTHHDVYSASPSSNLVLTHKHHNSDSQAPRHVMFVAW
jgi:hypothetical protein